MLNLFVVKFFGCIVLIIFFKYVYFILKILVHTNNCIRTHSLGTVIHIIIF